MGYNVLALPSAGMGFAILAEADITGQKLFMALIAYPLTVYPASLLRRFLGRRFGPRGAGVGLVALVPAWLFFFLLCVSQPQDIGPEELSALIGLLVFGAFAVENLIRVQLYVPVCGACAKTPMTKVKVLDYHPIRREVHLNLPGESARRAFSEANLGAQPV
ncbi:MAG: hypothetical protein HY928_13675 [Elusimicrobia bacterium]|nr:hypothetical protein [Elusimicrobiota bacterium]